ncbi:MAG: hypothetical protein ACRYE9_04055 [Janthinobacterium lividum]
MQRVTFLAIGLLLVILVGLLLKGHTKYRELISLKKAYTRISDVSIEDSAICNINTPGNVWLISYADGEVHSANQRALTVTAVNKCIDFIKPYNREHLDEEFLNENAKILRLPRGAGYWLWKPYIILKTLKEIPEADIVIYVDSGVTVNGKVDKLLNLFNNKDIIAFYTTHSNRPYVKRDLLRTMNMDNKEIRDLIQIQATFIALKNNKNTRHIVSEWLELCKNEKILTDSPSMDEYPDFIDHRHDQAIFSLLSLKYENNFTILPFVEPQGSGSYFNHHRRRDKSEGSLIYPRRR